MKGLQESVLAARAATDIRVRKVEAMYAAIAARNAGITENPFDMYAESDLHGQFAWMTGVLEPAPPASPAYADLFGNSI